MEQICSIPFVICKNSQFSLKYNLLHNKSNEPFVLPAKTLYFSCYANIAEYSPAYAPAPPNLLPPTPHIPCHEKLPMFPRLLPVPPFRHVHSGIKIRRYPLQIFRHNAVQPAILPATISTQGESWLLLSTSVK